MTERLQKFIASTGYLSRRRAEEAIVQGRVSVNGTVVTELGIKVDPAHDQVSVDGKLLRAIASRRTILLNKPRRVMTTMSDPEGRKTVMELLPANFQTLKPVGRLDFDSEGLLLLTEDGELANRIAHPRYGIHKVYRVRVRKIPSAQTLRQLTTSVTLSDGPGRFEKVNPVGEPRIVGGVPETELEITVSEGRNRFIRRMLDEVGHPVQRLLRIQVGGLRLGPLKSGEYLELSPRQLDQIFEKQDR
jgi:23S rRNA pseudouridine2605 synthase